jgi:signal transduction histidine kinase
MSLKNADLLFQTMADEAMMGIMAFEAPKNTCVYINKLAREILNLDETSSPSDIAIKDLFPKRKFDDYRCFDNETLANEGFYQDIVISRANAGNFMANLGVRRLVVGADELVLIMFQDITFQKKLQKEIALKQAEIKKAYEELLGQNKQLKELDLAKNRFIALTTHELRTPVAAIVGTADILVNKLYDDDNQKEEFIKTIFEQGNFLMALVNDILDFAKLQAGKMEYFIEQLNIADLVREQAHHFEPWAQKETLTIKFEDQGKTWPCYFDHMRTSQVVANIINNAIKFNKKNGRVDISLSVDPTDNYTIISVKDTGKGIDASKIATVFNEFETINDVSKHHKGTGLGMPISKRIIESQGGQIKLESELGVGTTFHVYVPNKKVMSSDLYRSRPGSDGDLAA